MNKVSCFYSAAAPGVCIVGHWAGQMEQKQEATLTQLTLGFASVITNHEFDIQLNNFLAPKTYYWNLVHMLCFFSMRMVDNSVLICILFILPIRLTAKS